MKMGSSFVENTNDTSVVNGWTISNLLRYDDQTFSLMYQIPTTSEVKLSNDFSGLYLYHSKFSDTTKWRLPYIYEAEINRVWFMNLPLVDNMMVYRKDVEPTYNKYSSIGRKNAWAAQVIAACKGDDNSYLNSERYWFPVMPLSDMFTSKLDKLEIPTSILTTFSSFLNQLGISNHFDDAGILIGPYQLNLRGPATETLQLILNDSYELIPQWAVNLYSTANTNGKIPSNAAAYSMKVGNTNLFIPAKSSLELGTKNTTVLYEEVSKTAVKLSATFWDSIKDLLNIVFLEEKELNNAFQNANSIVSIAYLFAVAVIPRVLFGSLFLFQILALLVNIKFVRLFCDRVFDFYKALTFGRIPYSEINVARVWISGTIGLVIIILLSRDYGSYILAKLISLILHIWGS